MCSYDLDELIGRLCLFSAALYPMSSDPFFPQQADAPPRNKLHAGNDVI